MGQDQDNTSAGGASSRDAASTADRPGDQTAAAGRSALVRKADVGRQEHQARAMTLAKALRLTAAKVADDLLDMAFAVIGMRAERCTGDGLARLFEGDGLLMLLEGPQRQRAAAVMDKALVGALIQQQTMGKVLAVPEGGDDRSLTDTDAAICAPFLDALLSRASPLPERAEDQALIHGFTFGARTPEPRLLLMALEAPAYRILYLTIDIEGGRRQGELMLCLPDAGAEARGPSGGTEMAQNGTSGNAPTAPTAPRTLSDPVMALPVDLPVALTRIRLTLSALSNLKVGEVLTLEDRDFTAARLLTPEGKGLGRGTLGQVQGQRALQLAIETIQTGSTPKFAGAMDRDHATEPDVAAAGFGAGLEERGDLTAALPDLPDLSDDGAGQDLPDLPDLPELDDLPELPELPDMSDLDDLAPLPDLPNLEDLKAG
ncbi:FliM/FliN family flagellar motor C-terminal domain-containing protein [Sulfitobacter sp. JB4-11]|uniref:FliM/FliN family flagellar motor C-terminal domain-containing protein n=1 Tax=Sulfitobacter rhodophyticola TaxID=3238304 RepID=UPI0035151A40